MKKKYCQERINSDSFYVNDANRKVDDRNRIRFRIGMEKTNDRPLENLKKAREAALLKKIKRTSTKGESITKKRNRS